MKDLIPSSMSFHSQYYLVFYPVSLILHPHWHGFCYNVVKNSCLYGKRLNSFDYEISWTMVICLSSFVLHPLFFMKYKFYILTILFLSSFALPSFAAPQAPSSESSTYTPQRTPEEIARKQTEMLVRDLEIKDSLQIDTIFRIHLRYARLRQVSNTRAEHLERVQQMYNELRQVLTQEQYEQFMNQQLESPRRPQPVCKMPQNTHPDRSGYGGHPHAPAGSAAKHTQEPQTTPPPADRR